MRARNVGFGFVGLFLAGCSAVPDTATLDRIEALLPRSACVGSLDRWSRHYAYQRRDGVINTNIVWIQLQEAGHRGTPAGRYTNTDVFDMIDDSDHRLAHGEYDVARGTISNWSCGENFPEGGPSGPGPFPEPRR